MIRTLGNSWLQKAPLLWLLAVSLAPTPGAAEIALPGGLTHELVVSQGGSYQGSITVLNPAPTSQEVKIYQTDYSFQADGTNQYGEPGTLPRSNARWISFTPKRFTVPARGRVDVAYRIRVPDDASLVGTTWSMLMVEGIPRTSPEAAGAGKDQIRLGLQQVLRYGIQMVTDLGDTGVRAIQFLDARLLREKKGRVLRVDLGNRGQRWLKAKLWAELYDPAGRSMGRREAGRMRTYPGTSVRFRVDLGEVPPGTYKALVVADCGGDNVFGSTYTLKVEP